MGLGIYKLSGGSGAISTDLTFSNPIVFFASSSGGVVEAKYFLRMENANIEYLTNGRLYAVDSSGQDESGWFSFARDEDGGPGEYTSELLFDIPLGSEIPIWIRVMIPSALEQEPKDDIRVTAAYIQHLIGDDD